MATKHRIDVMLSSTFRDLEQHRVAVIAALNGAGFTPLAQEFDAALSDSDLIKASLDKVAAADVYVGLIGSRYGQRPKCDDRNPDRLSLTELEYRRAVERKLPRLMFIMGEGHPLTLADLDRSHDEGEESHRLRKAFIARVRADRIAAEFSSPVDLKAQATTSFATLQKNLQAVDGSSTAPAQISSPSPDDFLPTDPPAFHYVRKPYLEKQGFAGRVKELALIDRWATGGDAMLLFQAIGGMGKSMLTWHWLRTRAANVRSDWAGRFWYSFYEQGADLNDFCVHALSYIRHKPAKTFRGRGTVDLGNELRRELDERPWLLVLDGLERVLVAYNRAGKEHMTDEEAVVVRDDMGLDREPRACFRPEDDDVLAMLAQAGTSKLLASSRLTPIALTNHFGQPIPGVERVTLEGLEPEDAEQVLRAAGVRGDGWSIRHFLQDKFRCHPLSVGIVAGQVMTFLDARGEFDRWVEHPKGGADPALITKDLLGRQNHILARAFDNLSPDEKALLGCLAMANIALTPDVLRLLNPMHPIEPQKVDPSPAPGDSGAEDFPATYEHWELKKNRDHAKFDAARIRAQDELDAFRKEQIRQQEALYDAYLRAHIIWEEKVEHADAWLAQSLPLLEARGLLQFDADAGSLDMHPAIRHMALLGLSADVRSSTGTHVSDVLSSRPAKAFADARDREDLALAMTRVGALNAAGKFNEGWALYFESGLDYALFRLGYAYEQLEIVQSYFPKGWEHDPTALPKESWVEALHEAARALADCGRHSLSLFLYDKAIKIELAEDRIEVSLLGNFAVGLERAGQRARMERLQFLAIGLATADEDVGYLLWLKANEVSNDVRRGCLDAAKATIVGLLKEIENEGVSAVRETHILKEALELDFRSGCLTDAIAERYLNRIKALAIRFDERQALETVAVWLQSRGEHQAALATFGRLIEIANETGSPHLRGYEARRALSLAILGRKDEARRIAARVDRGATRPHVPLASLYLELGDRDKARDHAIAGYTEAWGEGPPHHHQWDLADCRKVLAALGEPEPTLPPFDPSKIARFDFEPEIERLIKEMLAERAQDIEDADE